MLLNNCFYTVKDQTTMISFSNGFKVLKFYKV